MKNFGYCIWMIPNNEEYLNPYKRGFSHHLSVKTEMTLSESIKFINSLKQNSEFNSINVILGDAISSYEDNFAAIEFTVHIYNDEIQEEQSENPWWWPDGAHISFEYQYDEPFSLEKLQEWNRIMKSKKITLSKFIIMKCDGSYLDWKKVPDDIGLMDK